MDCNLARVIVHGPVQLEADSVLYNWGYPRRSVFVSSSEDDGQGMMNYRHNRSKR